MAELVASTEQSDGGAERCGLTMKRPLNLSLLQGMDVAQSLLSYPSCEVSVYLLSALLDGFCLTSSSTASSNIEVSSSK